ncbi:tRNA guanosine(15) transglycosylase TgtA [Candidatus Nitrosotenuis uzonensis]|uniref:tRNA-guanine(15) transglycosylase n=1 Tax=Candidatus Nitrosotenuis uzonensis TaxID=1407055 RepID=A0A812EWB1_9ARCH|nr:tRNA guanosine(15) transglycosylase TgtA [Candidatus Nitrosotenuis uzonensis]CAE6493674.1 tRNA-guanine(15) transglycosylase [Candidatus Nitrosotenuis uzonensis]
MFEVLKTDMAARIGILHTNHGKVETPAFVPVIHPVNQSIPAKKLKKIGFSLVITNAYITMNRYGEEAVRRGIHDIIDFDGAVMTDSGGYQVLEYGKVDVSSPEMASYERKIMTDIAIPLDRPTGYGLPKKKATEYVDYTLRISKDTLDAADHNGQIWCGPIQGAEHYDLVKRSTKALVEFGYKMLALGSPVEVMESYEYKILAEMILHAKKLIPSSIPLHLFGAGHPLTIPIAVALGCDTFDSASYMLYAKHDRYITEDRTAHLSEMQYFACSCEICSRHTPKEISSLAGQERTNAIALHNLYAIKCEVDRVKQAIHEGRLWEYTVKKIRAHPKLFETLGIFTENPEFFAKTTPRFKERALFLSSPEDQFRPEIYLHHKTVRKFRSDKKEAVIVPDSQRRPYYLSDEYSKIMKKFRPDKVQVCIYNPFFGITPLELSDLYPASHYVMADIQYKPDDFPEFAKTWTEFFSNNKFKTVHITDDRFLKEFAKFPARTRLKKIKSKKK